MGRGKHPEETKEKIISTSAQLFMTKGYEQTSIQDILDTLHLSKGGLYHHFKSKEEILEAVMLKRREYVSNKFHEIIQNTKAKNAKEKLQKILYQLAANSEIHKLDAVLTSQINPHFVVEGLHACMKEDAPIICQLIEEANDDGTLKVIHPAYCAEIFLMLLNYWANPVLFSRNELETSERLKYLQLMMNQLGLDIIDDDFITTILKAYASN